MPTGRRRSRSRPPRREPGAGRPANGRRPAARRSGTARRPDPAPISPPSRFGPPSQTTTSRSRSRSTSTMAVGSTSSPDPAATTSTVAGRPTSRRCAAPLGVVTITAGTPWVVETRMAGIDRTTGADDHRRGLRRGQPELATPCGICLGRRRVDVRRASSDDARQSGPCRPRSGRHPPSPEETHQEAIRFDAPLTSARRCGPRCRRRRRRRSC